MSAGAAGQLPTSFLLVAKPPALQASTGYEETG